MPTKSRTLVKPSPHVAMLKVQEAFSALTEATDKLLGHPRYSDVAGLRNRCSGLMRKLAETERMTKVANKRR